MPPVQKCRDCGRITRERTVGTPNGSCPARDAIHATHRYEVIRE